MKDIFRERLAARVDTWVDLYDRSVVGILDIRDRDPHDRHDGCTRQNHASERPE